MSTLLQIVKGTLYSFKKKINIYKVIKSLWKNGSVNWVGASKAEGFNHGQMIDLLYNLGKLF